MTIPDNNPLTFSYIDPKTLNNATCATDCPLSTDPSVPYQDFLFGGVPQALTGIEITLTGSKGAGPGLHILQLLSSGAFASAVDSVNQPSCFSTTTSSASTSGTWNQKEATTSIAATTQPVLVADVAVGSAPSAGPNIIWKPYISAAGVYAVNLLTPGCNGMEDCPFRTSVKVTVSPGGGLDDHVTSVNQFVTNDATLGIYNGPLLPSNSGSQVTIKMELDDNPFGKGSNGQYELVADRVQLVLVSVNFTTIGNGGNGGSSTTGLSGAGSTKKGFGFYEYALNTQTSVDATGIIPNTTETPSDGLGVAIFSALGSINPGFIVNVVAVHTSGTIFAGGNFTLPSGPTNIIAFQGGNLSPLANNGLNGAVTSLAIMGDSLFVGGAFTDTTSASGNGAFRGVVEYNVESQKWTPLNTGVNGAVTSLNINDGHLDVTGSFTQPTPGFASWNIANNAWVNTGGFLEGSMTLVANGTSSGTEFLAGSVSSSRQFGADGFAMISNGNGNEPIIKPLSIQFDSATSTTSSLARRATHRSWSPSALIPRLFARQSSTSSALPAPPVAIAPAVLAGAFWTNSSTKDDTVILGGNFSFSSGSTTFEGLGFYNSKKGSITGAIGSQINGTVRAVEVVDNTLFAGGQFTLSGTSTDGLAIYDLAKQEWDTSFQALQG